MGKKTPHTLLRENVRWSNERTAADPDYFRRLSNLQAPEFLWIGCSDSRVPANVITGLERVSRPGRRVYLGREDVPQVMGGLGTSILTTSRGVMTGREAVKAGVGGEVLCNIW